MSAHSGALEAVERVVNRGGEAEEVLAAVATILADRLGRPVRIIPEGFEVAGELDGEDRALLDRVTLLASPYH